ncbi:VapC toxin family PIN domain ribonuclease [Paramagnetospirillum kuznetsovii]|uniref:VapC toxin family PIN domain ribonuclease n=1 Tax=Paramagnetospirillum kuznetsovii TaxID=2053833 RepID=A0A364NVV5_9PROT|nr:type II toxin-antitoxin system VapC family toxin [Paramagnetospirillum kuznetsovii]RAU21047.1 VapC toxin family PIN domain ribonuclease [Paramagnetospirillum kuznetsovii]
MFLLDTVVVSEMRKPAARRNPMVVSWLDRRAANDLYISVITLGELERGIEAQRRINPVFATQLSVWFDQILSVYRNQILPMTVPIARRWGRQADRIGHMNPDLAIAATAIEHGLTVVTRNVSDFTPTGVNVFNPFEEPSP